VIGDDQKVKWLRKVSGLYCGRGDPAWISPLPLVIASVGWDCWGAAGTEMERSAKTAKHRKFREFTKVGFAMQCIPLETTIGSRLFFHGAGRS
jgi:hypothetical protein